MSYTLDTVIDRRNTHSLKYDFAAERGKPADVLPFWVADMDFQTSPVILDALQKAVSHGIFGYTESGDSYFEALHAWYKRYFGWETEKDWFTKTPGVVFAICAAIRAFTEPGDSVLIQPPVYYPFLESILYNHRNLVENPLIRRGGKYVMDLEDLEKKIRDNHVKLCLLCSPHNPVGRVWTKEELRQFSAVCRKYHVLVVADEIHQDFVYPGHVHTLFSSLGKEEESSTITCTAPSKTFNIAGLQASNIWIPNPELRRRFRDELTGAGYSQLGGMGVIACEAAYAGGRPWLEDVLVYLKNNIDFVRQYLHDNLPDIALTEPEGTYLLWLDFRKYGLSDKELERKLLYDAGLWLDMGAIFGKEGSGFARLNIACPRKTLEEGLNRLHRAFKN